MKTILDLGEEFRALRTAAGKTQEAVATAAGMRQEALSRFERGRGADFSLAKYLRLVELLNMELRVHPAVRRPTLDVVLAQRKGETGAGGTEQGDTQ